MGVLFVLWGQRRLLAACPVPLMCLGRQGSVVEGQAGQAAAGALS